jgi:hypothetical protein
MNGEHQVLGIVRDAQFHRLPPDPSFDLPARLTRINVMEAVPPESREIDLSEYEGKAIMVAGHDQGGWIYSAEVIDEAGPILTAVVEKVFGPDLS